ncbi:myosin heavy subunit [Aquamicrobium terrae]
MVQSVLFFILGFLAATFLVVLVGPAVWRRAVVLTRRRIAAAAPLTLAEMQADKDRIRAGFALTARKLEMEIKALKDRVAAQMVELGRAGEELKKLAAERDTQGQALAAERARDAELEAMLEERGGQVRTLTEKLAEAESLLEERALELKKLGNLYEEASFSSSNRQIELVARESELEKLSNDIAVLRAQRKEADKRQRDFAAESRAVVEALKNERKKVAGLDRKLEKLMATLADCEDKLDRREGELARLRQKLEGREQAAPSPDTAAGPESRDAAAPAGTQGSEIDRAVARLNADRERLEARLTALARENRQLKTDLATIEGPVNGRSGAEQRDGELREQMSDLAAEVVHLAAMLEGPDSAIAKALAAPEPDGGQQAGRMRSLADRVRALQKAAPPG